MALADHARLLVAYNTWANQRLLQHALSLDDEALHREGGASKGSILGNLQHVVSAQDVWLRRWRGQPWRQYEPPGRDGIAAAFSASDRDLQAFAGDLTDEGWDRVIKYKNTSGVPYEVQLGVLITHVVNHGTLHRGEAGMLLAAHGRSPGDLDFVYFVLEREAAG